jgi:hypothetical protein
VGRGRSLPLLTTTSTPPDAARQWAAYGAVVVLVILLCDLRVLAVHDRHVQASLAVRPAAAATAIPATPSSTAATTPPSTSPVSVPRVVHLPVQTPVMSPVVRRQEPVDLAPGWEQRRGAAALARITYPWQELGYSIQFFGPMAGLLGGTVPNQHLIALFVRPNEHVNLLTSVIAHELGHAVDKTYNNDDRRRRWLEARGLPSTTPWFTCDKCTDLATGSGDFAEVFVAWQTRHAYFRGQLAPAPTDTQLAALQEFFQP